MPPGLTALQKRFHSTTGWARLRRRYLNGPPGPRLFFYPRSVLEGNTHFLCCTPKPADHDLQEDYPCLNKLNPAAPSWSLTTRPMNCPSSKAARAIRPLIFAICCADTGYTVFDTGYKNSASCSSTITYLDGKKGILRYRGYAIEDLGGQLSVH